MASELGENTPDASRFWAFQVATLRKNSMTLYVNAGKPVLNAADFAPQFLQPGQDGVPPCEGTVCDDWETVFGNTGRNMFRGPFQVRFDMSVAKQFPVIKERYQLRFEIDGFNIFNHPILTRRTTMWISSPAFTGRLPSLQRAASG